MNQHLKKWWIVFLVKSSDMLTYQGERFERMNFGAGKMYGWISVSSHGVRGSITNASQSEMEMFRVAKKESQSAIAEDICIEDILPTKSWNVFPDLRSAKPGRPQGFSPILGEDGAMVKKAKAWSMPQSDWDWLESQSNQAETIRDAIAMYRLMRSRRKNK